MAVKTETQAKVLGAGLALFQPRCGRPYWSLWITQRIEANGQVRFKRSS